MTIFGVFASNKCGGYYDTYIIVADNIQQIYLHFLERFKENYVDKLTLKNQEMDIHDGFNRNEYKLLKNKFPNITPMYINTIWNLTKKGEYDSYDDEMYLDDLILKDDDINFDIGLTKYHIPKNNKSNHKSATEQIIYMLIAWYCKKFKITSDKLSINDMKKLFKIYADKSIHGLYISPIEYGFTIGNKETNIN